MPPEWVMVRLGDIMRPVDRAQRRITVQDDETYSLLSARWYAKGIVLKEHVTGESLKTKTWFRAESGDFIMLKIWVRRGSYGFLPDGIENPILSNDFPILALDRSKADQDYVSFYLSQSHIWEGLNNQAEGIGRQRVQEDEFIKLITLPLPPLPEQRAIASALRSIQHSIAATEQVIAAARDLKRSAMRHLFTYGLVTVEDAEQVELKETEIGLVPEHWEVVRLDSVVKIVSGGTPSRNKPEYWNGDIPWVKTGEVNYNRITVTEERITQEGLENSSARVIPSGTLLMALYGQGVTRGRVAILAIDAAVNQACAAMLASTKISAKYLFYLFTLRYQEIRNLGHGAHQKNLSATLLNQLRIPLPPIREQAEVDSLLSSVDHKISAEEQWHNALESLFRSVLQRLMTGQVRVEVTGSSSSINDEAAITSVAPQAAS